MTNKRFAVIGSGAAGLAAAWRLHQAGHVTLYERNRRLGGHAWTVRVPDGPDAGLPLDIAFMIMNERRYPTMTSILATLPGIELADSEMSFSYTCRQSQHSYAINHTRGGAARLGASSAWIHHARLAALARQFGRVAQNDLTCGDIDGLTFGDYLEQRGIERALVDTYLVPMGAALWSCPAGQIMDFPARRYLQFFDNHGLLALSEHLTWRHVVGGCERYVRTLLDRLAGIDIRTEEPVWRVEQACSGVSVHTTGGRVAHYDGVVIATHADEASALLGNAQHREKALLGAIRYQSNEATVHWDETVMPPDQGCWAAWNYERALPQHGECGGITYYLNVLQGHTDAARDYFVTLNRDAGIDPDKALLRAHFRHPIFDFAAMQAQEALCEQSEQSGIRFAGSYLGYGFHEDAMSAGVAAAQSLSGARR